MTDRLSRTIWLGVLGAIIAGPALLWLATAPAEPLWSRLSVITGLFALSALVCAAIVPSRIRSLNRAFGIESVMEVHRFLGVAATFLVLAHLACVVAADPANAALLDVFRSGPPAKAAVGATVALVALVAAAVLRRVMGVSYETWRWLHVGLVATVIVLSVLHVWWLDHLVRNPGMQLLLGVLVAIFVMVAAYRWVWRTLLDPATEFVVREVRAENATVSTLVLGPRDGRHSLTESWAFAPGQFAWLRLERTLTAEEHPFTIASSAHHDGTEFTIRHAGDFTRELRQLPPGSSVWVDGPHGAFTTDVGPCHGFVMIAGGVGITPMMSMLRTAAHRGDTRPYRLIVTATCPEDLLFRDELGRMRDDLDLEVTEVLRRPRDGWDGHTGDLGADLLSLVLGTVDDAEHLDYFICGPPGLVDAAMDVIDALDVAPSRVHTELFDLV